MRVLGVLDFKLLSRGKISLSLVARREDISSIKEGRI